MVRHTERFFLHMVQHVEECFIQTLSNFLGGPMAAHCQQVRIRRDHLYLDSIKALNVQNLAQRIQVTFVSEHGTEEAGIDGGGVFKEYMDAITKVAFDPQSNPYCIFLSNSQNLQRSNLA